MNVNELLSKSSYHKLISITVSTVSALSCLLAQPAHAFIFGFGGSSSDDGSQSISFNIDVNANSLLALPNGSYPNAIKDFEIDTAAFGSSIPVFAEDGLATSLTVTDCLLPADIELTCVSGLNQDSLTGSFEEVRDGLLDRRLAIEFEGLASEELSSFTSLDTDDAVGGVLEIVLTKRAKFLDDSSYEILPTGFTTYSSPTFFNERLEPVIFFSTFDLPKDSVDIPEPKHFIGSLLVFILYGFRRRVR